MTVWILLRPDGRYENIYRSLESAKAAFHPRIVTFREISSWLIRVYDEHERLTAEIIQQFPA